MRKHSLSLESKLLLTALVICGFVILRLIHMFHISDQIELILWINVAIIIASWCEGTDRYPEAGRAVAFLSVGVLLAVIKSFIKSSVLSYSFFGVVIAICFVAFVINVQLAYAKFRAGGGWPRSRF